MSLSPLTVYKPGAVDVRGLRTALKKSQLRPGEFAEISNWRWSSGALTVREGMAVIATTVPWTTILGAAALQANGTQYVFAAGVVDGDTAFYSLALATGVLTELTQPAANPPPTFSGTQGFAGNVAGAASGGKTRMDSTTAPVTFTVHTRERRVVGGTVIPAVDVISIQNGADIALVYNPTLSLLTPYPEFVKVFTHRDVVLQPGCTKFTYYPALTSFLQIGTAAAQRLYYRRNDDGTTQTRWFMGDTVAAPYDVSPSVCILFTNAAAQDGDLTHFLYQNAQVNFPGEEISFLLEGTAAAISDWTQNFAFMIAPQASASGTVAGVTNATPAVFATSTAHGLTDGASVFLEGTGTSGGIVSGLYYAKITGVGTPATHFALYGDEALTDPIASASTTLVGTQTWVRSQVYTVYDSSSSNPVLTNRPTITPQDIGNNRQMATYSLANVPIANRDVARVAFRRNGDFGGTNYTLSILLFAGTGEGGGFPGDIEWGIGWRDTYAQAESHGFTGTRIDPATIDSAGGPNVVTQGSGDVAGATLPETGDVLFDFVLNLVNPGPYSHYAGGLLGIPNAVDLYFRTNEESEAGVRATYWNTVTIFAPFYTAPGGGGWIMSDHWSTVVGSNDVPDPVMNIATQLYGWASGSTPTNIDRELRDPGVPLPSPFNIAMPRAAAVGFANQRTIVGAIRDDTDTYQLGDIYISTLGFPFRFQSIQDSDVSGTRTVASGQRIRRIVMTSAAANGASIIYIVTDIRICALGTAGGNVGSGYDTTSLGVLVDIASNGTNEPRSLVERNGLIHYLDNFGQVNRFSGGAPTPISRNQVDNLFREIPASRRGFATGDFFEDSYYLAFTPTGGTTNTRILVRNVLALNEWEALDYLPSGVTADRLVTAFDSTFPGGGQRLLVFSDGDHKIYGYEEGTTEPGSSVGPSITLTTREWQEPDLAQFRFERTQIMMDAQDATLTRDAIYTNNYGGGTFRSTFDLSSVANPTAIRLDTQVPDQIAPAAAVTEGGWSGYLKFTGALKARSVMWRTESNANRLSAGAASRG